MLAVSLRDELSMSIFAMQSLSCCSCSKNKQVFVIIYTIHTRREEINPFFYLYYINLIVCNTISKGEPLYRQTKTKGMDNDGHSGHIIQVATVEKTWA